MKPTLPTPRVAILVALAYAPLAAWFSPIFPFCTVPMYADIGGYHTSHVPIFLADGEPADPADFVDFTGMDAEAIVLPPPASLDFVTERHRWWVSTHAWNEEGPPPPVEVAYGWALYEAGDHGVERGPFHVETRGHARLR
ncbi:MAG: hypothetical protein H6732_12750 [Alphaproteobacteria bacterium]|nr:hypothetical protein [Alphaproteobacteria bacterium]